MTAADHWQRWHDFYDDPTSYLSRRLAIVQRRLIDALSSARSGEIRLISLCAGEGRDVVGVLTDHRRRADVRGRLIELDPSLCAAARAGAAQAGLDGIEVVEADAGDTAACAGATPADVVLVCGVFGNIADDDIRRTVEELPRLCGSGATVIWTRHRRPPDVTPSIRRWFAGAGFQEIAFDTEPGSFFSVGTARLVAPPLPFRPGQRMFTFVGDGADAHA